MIRTGRLLWREARLSHSAKATYCINGNWVDSDYWRMERAGWDGAWTRGQARGTTAPYRAA